MTDQADGRKGKRRRKKSLAAEQPPTPSVTEGTALRAGVKGICPEHHAPIRVYCTRWPKRYYRCPVEGCSFRVIEKIKRPCDFQVHTTG